MFCRENVIGWALSDVVLFPGNADLWKSGTASKYESKRSKPNLEDGSSTKDPKVNVRGIGALPFL